MYLSLLAPFAIMSGSGFAGSQATGDKRQTFNTFFRDLAVEVKAKGNEAGPLKHDWQGLFKILNTGQKLLAEAVSTWWTKHFGNAEVRLSWRNGPLQACKSFRRGSDR